MNNHQEALRALIRTAKVKLCLKADRELREQEIDMWITARRTWKLPTIHFLITEHGVDRQGNSTGRQEDGLDISAFTYSRKQFGGQSTSMRYFLEWTGLPKNPEFIKPYFNYFLLGDPPRKIIRWQKEGHRSPDYNNGTTEHCYDDHPPYYYDTEDLIFWQKVLERAEPQARR